LESVRAEFGVPLPVTRQAEPPEIGVDALFLIFCGPADPPKVRYLGGKGFDPNTAVVMHYNVDALTLEKMVFVGGQAAALHIDLIHLVDVRVTALQWPGVKKNLTAALAGTRMHWSFLFYEGGGRLPKQCSIGGQIIAYTNRLSKVTGVEMV